MVGIFLGGNFPGGQFSGEIFPGAFFSWNPVVGIESVVDVKSNSIIILAIKQYRAVRFILLCWDYDSKTATAQVYNDKCTVTESWYMISFSYFIFCLFAFVILVLFFHFFILFIFFLFLFCFHLVHSHELIFL